jgi:hypothetical protein
MLNIANSKGAADDFRGAFAFLVFSKFLPDNDVFGGDFEKVRGTRLGVAKLKLSAGGSSYYANNGATSIRDKGEGRDNHRSLCSFGHHRPARRRILCVQRDQRRPAYRHDVKDSRRSVRDGRSVSGSPVFYVPLQTQGGSVQVRRFFLEQF